MNYFSEDFNSGNGDKFHLENYRDELSGDELSGDELSEVLKIYQVGTS